MKNRIIFFLVWVMVINLNGCAFFNTFFNARKAFNNGMTTLQHHWEQQYTQIRPETDIRPDLFDEKYLSSPDEAKKFFTLAIEKGNKVVVLYPDSRWVEDAILLLGKAHFLRGTGNDFYDARNRFEVFFIKYPDSKKMAEARLWYARTLSQLNQPDQAVLVLRDALQNPAPPDVAAEIYLLLGESAYATGRLADAVQAFSRADSLARRNSLRKHASFRLAYTWMETGNYESASRILKKMLRMDLSVPERYIVAQMTGRALKYQRQFTEALRLLDRLLGDFRMKNYYPYIESEIADILIRQGRIDEAEKQLIFIINHYPQPALTGDAYFRLAMIADTLRHDPDTAIHYLQIIKTKYPQASFFAQAEQKLNHFNQIEFFHQSIHLEQDLLRWIDRMIAMPDSLYPEISSDTSRITGSLYRPIPEDSLSDAVDSLTHTLTDSLDLDNLQWLKELESADATTGEESDISAAERTDNKTPTTDTAKVKNLFQRDLLLIRPENNPLKERRQLIDTEKNHLRRLRSADSLKQHRPGVEERIATLYHDLAAYYQSTEGYTDSALFYYGQIINLFPKSPWAEAAMYARAGIYEKFRPHLFLMELRNAYRAFPEGRLAHIYHQVMKTDESADDTLGLYFRHAETAMFDNRWRDALFYYRQVAQRDTGEERRRALYLSGLIYQRMEQNDSAFVALNTLAFAYPSDPLTQKINPKLRQYTTHRRIASDSLIWFVDTTIIKIDFSLYHQKSKKPDVLTDSVKADQKTDSASIPRSSGEENSDKEKLKEEKEDGEPADDQNKELRKEEE